MFSFEDRYPCYNPKRKKPFNIQFRNEKNLGKTIFLVHLKYVLDYIQELPEQFQWLKNIDEKNNDERKPPGPSLKKSQPECNDSEGAASESEIEHPAAKTAPTPAAPQNKKKVAAVPNKKDLIPDSVLSDAETDSDAPLESDDSDLYEGGEDGAAEQKQDNEDDSMLRWQQIKRFFKCSDPNTEEEEMQKGNG